MKETERAEKIIDAFVKDWRKKNNTKDAIYSAYHYDAMVAFAEHFSNTENKELRELLEETYTFMAIEKTYLNERYLKHLNK